MASNYRGSHARRSLAVGLAVLAGGAMSGCGGAEKTPATAPARLLSIDDLGKYPKGSPESALLRYLFFIQWGSARDIIASVDPAISEAVGVAELIDAYAFLRPAITSSKLRIVGDMQTSQGLLVLFEMSPATGPSQSDAILFGRVGGSYVMRYDTQLDRGIPGSIRAAAAGEPQTKQGQTRVSRRIAEVMAQYRSAAGGAALKAAQDRARRSAGSASAGNAAGEG